jgi:hypothetical protein
MSSSRFNKSGSRILSTKATYFVKSLFRGRAMLFRDRIEVSSIGLMGASKKIILIESLSHVKADAAIGGKNIYLVFRNGSTVRLGLARGAALWDLKIKECLGLSTSDMMQTPESLHDQSMQPPEDRNRYTGDRVADESNSLPDSSDRSRNVISKSGNSVWAGSRGNSADHPSIQFPAPTEN